MKKIANLINETVNNYEANKDKIKEEVNIICKEYPLYK